VARTRTALTGSGVRRELSCRTASLQAIQLAESIYTAVDLCNQGRTLDYIP
jgi:hypothetical protein